MKYKKKFSSSTPLLLLSIVGRRLGLDLKNGRAGEDGALVELALDVLAGDEDVGLAFGDLGDGGGGHVA